MIYVAVPFIVCPGPSSSLLQLEETSASTLFCYTIMLDDAWSKMSALGSRRRQRLPQIRTSHHLLQRYLEGDRRRRGVDV
jgi:hypothetical protein